MTAKTTQRTEPAADLFQECREEAETIRRNLAADRARIERDEADLPRMRQKLDEVWADGSPVREEFRFGLQLFVEHLRTRRRLLSVQGQSLAAVERDDFQAWLALRDELNRDAALERAQDAALGRVNELLDRELPWRGAVQSTATH